MAVGWYFHSAMIEIRASMQAGLSTASCVLQFQGSPGFWSATLRWTLLSFSGIPLWTHLDLFRATDWNLAGRIWSRSLLLSSPKKKITSRLQTSTKEHPTSSGSQPETKWALGRRWWRRFPFQKKSQLDSLKASAQKAPRQPPSSCLGNRLSWQREMALSPSTPFCIGISTSLFFQWSSLLFQLTPLWHSVA